MRKFTILNVKQAEKDKFLILFGKKVVELRKQKGISQEELSYASDISLSTISKLERGELNISVLNLYKLSRVLKIHFKDFLDFDI